MRGKARQLEFKFKMGSTPGRANTRHTSTSKQEEAKMSRSMEKQANKPAASAKMLPRSPKSVPIIQKSPIALTNH